MLLAALWSLRSLPLHWFGAVVVMVATGRWATSINLIAIFSTISPFRQMNYLDVVYGSWLNAFDSGERAWVPRWIPPQQYACIKSTFRVQWMSVSARMRSMKIICKASQPLFVKQIAHLLFRRRLQHAHRRPKVWICDDRSIGIVSEWTIRFGFN